MLSLPEFEIEAQRLLRDIDAEELFKNMETWFQDEAQQSCLIRNYRGNIRSVQESDIGDTADTFTAPAWGGHLPTFAPSDTNPTVKIDVADGQQQQPLATCDGLSSLGNNMRSFVPTSLAQQTTLTQAQQITPLHAQLIFPSQIIPTVDGKSAETFASASASASATTSIALPIQSVAPWPSLAWSWLFTDPAGLSSSPTPAPAPAPASTPTLALSPSTIAKHGSDGGQHGQRLDTTGTGACPGTSVDADAGAADSLADLLPDIFPSMMPTPTLGSLDSSTLSSSPFSLLTHPTTTSSSLPFPESLAFMTLPDLSFISNADTTSVDANILAMNKSPLNPYVAVTSTAKDAVMTAWKSHKTASKNNRSITPTNYAPLELSPSPPWTGATSRVERKRTWDNVQDEEEQQQQRETLLPYASTFSLPAAVQTPSILMSSSFPLPLSTRTMTTADAFQAASQPHTHKKARIGTRDPLCGVPYRSTLPSSPITSLYDTLITSPFVSPSSPSILSSISSSQTTTMPTCLVSGTTPSTSTPTPITKSRSRSSVSLSPLDGLSSSSLQQKQEKQQEKQEFYFMEPYQHSTIKVDRRSCNSRKELKMAQARARALSKTYEIKVTRE
ncbi:MAG: hypothetical protein J3Q66DRAFT_440049 [Benniella sp.]|nr:MAG: hypothetical protein J3Q66DRAFT_440049 [Benniella sp.]